MLNKTLQSVLPKIVAGGPVDADEELARAETDLVSNIHCSVAAVSHRTPPDGRDNAKPPSFRDFTATWRVFTAFGNTSGEFGDVHLH